VSLLRDRVPRRLHLLRLLRHRFLRVRFLSRVLRVRFLRMRDRARRRDMAAAADQLAAAEVAVLAARRADDDDRHPRGGHPRPAAVVAASAEPGPVQVAEVIAADKEDLAVDARHHRQARLDLDQRRLGLELDGGDVHRHVDAGGHTDLRLHRDDEGDQERAQHGVIVEAERREGQVGRVATTGASERLPAGEARDTRHPAVAATVCLGHQAELGHDGVVDVRADAAVEHRVSASEPRL
jgi:hypothetical protein